MAADAEHEVQDGLLGSGNSTLRLRRAAGAIGPLSLWLGKASILGLSALLLSQLLGLPAWLAATLAFLAWAALLFRGCRRGADVWWIALLLSAALWYASLRPSNGRDWAPEVSRLPLATVQGSRLVISDLRDFRWQSTQEFEASWREETYELDRLDSLELLVEPFGESEWLAHVMLRFGFADGKRLVVSVEARREQGEVYGILAGAARQFELIYVLTTDADAVALRLQHRGSRVYAYPIRADRLFMQTLLLDLCESANALHDRPQFYALLRHNCTTTLLRHVDRRREEKIGWRKDILFPARTGALIHRLGLMDTELPFGEARERFRL